MSFNNGLFFLLDTMEQILIQQDLCLLYIRRRNYELKQQRSLFNMDSKLHVLINELHFIFDTVEDICSSGQVYIALQISISEPALVDSFWMFMSIVPSRTI